MRCHEARGLNRYPGGFRVRWRGCGRLSARSARGNALKPHLRSAVIQSFEFTYELSIRMLRRVLIERAESADRVTDLSFNELMRNAADAGLLEDPLTWRQWREMRNATRHAYDETRGNEVATGAIGFVPVCDGARGCIDS